MCKPRALNKKTASWMFLHDAGTAGMEHPEARKMIKEALKRNKSKQPRPNWGNPWKLVDLPSWSEIFKSFHKRSMGMKGMRAFGPFLMIYIVSLYWMEGLEGFVYFNEKCCLIYFKWKSNHSEAMFSFEVVYILKGCVSFIHFFKNPTVSNSGRRGATQLRHWCRE